VTICLLKGEITRQEEETKSPSSESDHIENDPVPVDNDPVPVVNDPVPVENDPVPVVNDPVPVENDPVIIEYGIDSYTQLLMVILILNFIF